MIGNLYLRARASSLGRRAKVIGAPSIHRERGTVLEIGDDLVLSSRPVRSHIAIARNGRVRIGNHVTIACAAAIACELEVRIGDGCELGRRVMILDTDFHDTKDFSRRSESAPITIEDGVVLEDGVIVLKGSHIGRNARIREHGVVSGAIPPNAVAAGIPARVLREKRDVLAPTRDEILDRVKLVVAETFRLERAVDERDGPDRIPTWDSLGALRLLSALEEDLGVSLADDALLGAASVSDITRAILERI